MPRAGAKAGIRRAGGRVSVKTGGRVRVGP